MSAKKTHNFGQSQYNGRCLRCSFAEANSAAQHLRYTDIVSKLSVFLCVVICLIVFTASSASALPWDQDLFKQQSLKPNEIARAPVPGTVPVGAQPFTLTPDEAAVELTNPTPADEDSLSRGKRLWNVNCLPCHGEMGDAQGVPVGPLLGAPSLLTDFYKAREDGRIFATIHLGGANMPAYGHKINHQEKWDIVNYLRYLQNLAKGK